MQRRCGVDVFDLFHFCASVSPYTLDACSQHQMYIFCQFFSTHYSVFTYSSSMFAFDCVSFFFCRLIFVVSSIVLATTLFSWNIVGDGNHPPHPHQACAGPSRNHLAAVRVHYIDGHHVPRLRRRNRNVDSRSWPTYYIFCKHNMCDVLDWHHLKSAHRCSNQSRFLVMF